MHMEYYYPPLFIQYGFAIIIIVKSLKVPKSTYSQPAEKERLAQAFEFNRRKAEVKLIEHLTT